MNPILGNKALAINQTETNDINSIDSNQYPQIKEMLQKIKISSLYAIRLYKFIQIKGYMQ